MNSAYRIALAGNPNTGKSTLFNALTGLKQHTGNWAGKTVSMAEGSFTHKDKKYKLIDLPGTYSLFSNSADEEVARNYILFEQPDVTLVVVDATSLERNLNLALQVMEMTKNVIICVNLIDEAERKGIQINEKVLMKRTGVPVIKLSARNKVGFNVLLDTIDRVIGEVIECQPVQTVYSEQIEEKIAKIESKLLRLDINHLSARWVALRLLDGDMSLMKKLTSRLGEGGKTQYGYQQHILRG
ncbi:FeoB small GTPase domain-containing protein [Priestia flexa]|uniref:FeoB small GTPase domain-containing protein n=1 Tax=Priestia flexa TaxID=86664 RepID=UPI002891BA71|nr:FeoB small GTPase domain-containing protein [Priestia flexa]MDT2046533.1 FeoB small GTPase domain-containing protein [Priestia flexa]